MNKPLFTKEHTDTDCWTPGLHFMAFRDGKVKKDYCECLKDKDYDKKTNS